MERKIKVYKSPEEIEKFNKEFYQRICLQEALWRAHNYQQRYPDYQKVYDEKMALPKPDFSAS